MMDSKSGEKVFLESDLNANIEKDYSEPKKQVGKNTRDYMEKCFRN